MDNFEQIQGNMANQMQQQLQSDDLKKVTEALAQAAEDLRVTNQNMLMQQQMEMSMTQQQSQAINHLAMQQQTGGNAPPPFPSIDFQPAIAFAKDAGGFAKYAGGQYAQNAAERARIQAQSIRETYSMGAGQFGLSAGQNPGMLTAPNAGIIGSAHHMLASSWNPNQAQNYSFGAYQRAQAINMGQAVSDTLGGMRDATLGMVGAEGLYDVMMPVGLNMALSMTGLDAPIRGGLRAIDETVNPINIAMQEAARARAFGNTANQYAHTFLRGATGGLGLNSLSEGQQGDIGMGIARMTLDDFTFSSQDILGLQSGMAQTGQYLGVQNTTQYLERTRKAIGQYKNIMKTLQLSNEEALQAMDQMYSTVGVDHDAEMSRMTSRIYSSAILSGASPQQMMEASMRGAQQAGQYGMMNVTGARMMLSSQALAGMAATNNVPTDVLASVGGQRGLGDLLNASSGNFMQGAGGVLMHFTGGNVGPDVTGALSRAGSNLGSDDLISFIANRHRSMDQFSPEQIQAQQALMMYGMAQDLEGAGGNLRDRMLIVLQSQGYSATQAEALLESYKSLPQSLERQNMAGGQARADAARDAFAEQNSLIGRLRSYGRRNFMGEGTFSGELAEGMVRFDARVGDYVSYEAQALSDRYLGLGRRRIFKQDDVQRLMGTVEEIQTRSRSSFDPELQKQLTGFFEDPIHRRTKMAVQDAASAGEFGMNAEVDVLDTAFRNITGRAPSSTEDYMALGTAAGVDTDAMQRLVGFDRGRSSRDNFDSEKFRQEWTYARIGLNPVTNKQEEVEAALADAEFQEALKMLNETYSLYDRSSTKGQSNKYKGMEARTISKIKSLTDKEAQIMDSLLRERGIKIENNKFNWGGVRTMGKSGELFDDLGIGLDETLFDPFEKVRDRQLAATSAARTMSDVFGIRAEVDGDRLQEDLDTAVQQLVGAASSFTEEDLQKIQKRGASGELLAKSLKYAQQEGFEGFQAADRDIIAQALVSMDLESMVGTTFENENKLSKDFLGNEAAKNMRQAAQIQSDTIKALLKMQQDLGMVE